MPVYLIPVLIALAITIVTVGVSLLFVFLVFGEVDLEDVKLSILLCALCFGLPAAVCFALLV